MTDSHETYRLTNYELPRVLRGVPCVASRDILLPEGEGAKAGMTTFPKLYGLPELTFSDNAEAVAIGKRMKVGVVFGGGTAPGVVELVVGLRNYLARWNSSSSLVGFRCGMKGLVTGDHITIDDSVVHYLIKEGGLGCIGTGAHTLSQIEYKSVADTCAKLGLTGLVVIGGSGFQLSALHLAEYFAEHSVATKVLSASKRMEIANQKANGKPLELGIGFDSVTKLYSFLVGNLAADVASAQSSYHIVRLMGDEKSGQLTLEVALETHPNVVFINEEVQAKKYSLKDLVKKTCDVVCERSRKGIEYGIILLSEGILDSVTETSRLLHDVADQISKQNNNDPSSVLANLPMESRALAEELPLWFVEQIVSQRKRGVNQVHNAELQVERMFGVLCQDELVKRKAAGTFLGKFSFHSHFFGYETRCQQPSLFDCQLGATIGCALGALVEKGVSGYMVGARGVSGHVADWEPVATPLSSHLSTNRKGQLVMGNGQVRLDGYPYRALEMLRGGWVEDCFRPCVGTLSDAVPTTVQLSDLQHRHEHAQGNLTSAGQAKREQELSDLIKKLACEENSFLRQRLEYSPPVPQVLRGAYSIDQVELPSEMPHDCQQELQTLFPNSFSVSKAFKVSRNVSETPVFTGAPLRIGIVLSGGPAPGGHNIISGLHDFLTTRNRDSVLVGFVQGPKGLLEGNTIVIDEDVLSRFRNQGGFNLIGTSRTKIETAAQFEQTKKQVERLRLDGLVICGGDDSNTNAALLADYFIGAKVATRVVGMPKTIDADLRTKDLEMSFGFDTTTKVYSSLLGNVMQECLVRADRWHFVRLMGRSASHIAVEVALQTHPNFTIISEEVAEKKRTIMSIVREVADLVSQRNKQGKQYGVVVVPEGLIEVSTDMKLLVEELNDLLAQESNVDLEKRLTPESAEVYKQLPDWLCSQLLSDRDPHGNVRVSLIESERLLATLVAEELLARKDAAAEAFKFWCHFFGYQGRCALTSNFDCTYTYVLGHLAGALVEGGATGVIGAVRNLTSPIEEWELLGLPITAMMRLERRKGQSKPVIEKKLVDLNGIVFSTFSSLRQAWALGDCYPNRMEMRTGHLSGVHDDLGTQTLRLEFPAKKRSRL